MVDMTLNFSLTIEPLNRLDQAQVNALFELCMTDTFKKENLMHLETLLQDEIAYKKSLVDDALSENRLGFRFWVAKKQNQVVGIVSYGPCGEDIMACSQGVLAHLGELGSLYVLPDHQNQGIGSWLIQTVAQDLMTLGIDQFVLDSGYRTAQERWKQKFGVPWIEIQDYWGPNMPHCVWLVQSSDHMSSSKES